LIPELFDAGSIDALSKLILINVIYFKGDWLYPFDPEQTAEMEFFVDAVTNVSFFTFCHH
jgi:serpin B